MTHVLPLYARDQNFHSFGTFPLVKTLKTVGFEAYVLLAAIPAVPYYLIAVDHV